MPYLGKNSLKNVSIFTFGTVIKSFLSILVYRNNNILLIDSNITPFRRNKSPFREKESYSHFETVRLNRGPHNKHHQNSMFNFFIFFLGNI